MNDARAMNALLSKIYSTLTSPDSVTGTNSFNQNAFVSFCVPGIPIPSAALDFLNLTSTADFEAAARFSRFANFAPKPTGFWIGSGPEIWQIYEDALNSAVVEPRQLTDQQKGQLKDAEDKLWTYKSLIARDGTIIYTKQSSQLQLDYNAFKQAYQSALLSLNKVIMTAKNDPNNNEAAQDLALNGPIYRQNVDDAFQQWNTVKSAVEVAQETIAELSSDGPLLLFQSMRNDLHIMQMMDSQKSIYYSTTFFPAQFWNADSWTTFSLAETEEHQYWSDSTTSWGGGVAGVYGLWYGSVGVSHTDTVHHDSCNTRNYKVSFDLIQIPLVRPWLNPMLFMNHAWRLQQGGAILSDGNPLPSTGGTLPLLPTSLLVARNLSVSLDMTDEDNTSYRSETNTKGTVGWGLFSLRGGYDKVSSGGTHDYKSSDDGIKCSGMQVIGFVCDIVPKSPNPDPALLSERLARFGTFHTEPRTSFYRIPF